ncbi:hypothetical protein DSO57_1030239 [Entomophthora muscae]|uniref:Uncharacterized protein n=1 Tax=Entomophthora muscae TaxID=34485 RepID=A0ACC2SQC8_9FUNG|nr:hypothetical protein DSO57_1030239 [Entomophthora muscae]
MNLLNLTAALLFGFVMCRDTIVFGAPSSLSTSGLYATKLIQGLSIDEKRLSENLTLVVGHMPTKPSCAIHSKELKNVRFCISERDEKLVWGEKTRVSLPKQCYPRKRCALDIDTPFKMKWSSNFSESLSLSKMYEIMHPSIDINLKQSLTASTPPHARFSAEKAGSRVLWVHPLLLIITANVHTIVSTSRNRIHYYEYVKLSIPVTIKEGYLFGAYSTSSH